MIQDIVQRRSDPAGRSAHTGAPARGRAGGGGCCCRCQSPSPSRRDCPPCCRLCGRLPLSLWPKPRRASRRSSRGEEDTARRRGAAGRDDPGSELGAPAAGRRLPALSLSLCSCRCQGFQAVRCRCAPCKRRAVEASRSRLAHAGPHSTGKSLACSYAPGRRSPSEHEVRSPPPAPPPTSLGAPLPAAACASPGSHAPPPGRRVLCQLATHGIDCPRLPRLERVAFTAWQGRGARHPRRFADPARARVSLLGSPSGAASIPKGKKVGSADFLRHLVGKISVPRLLLAVRKTEAKRGRNRRPLQLGEGCTGPRVAVKKTLSLVGAGGDYLNPNVALKSVFKIQED
ncbi:PREDICTED: uncharacterized protein LOC109376208 [Hipposideros armiger]|uniref:Uncharacterized protein LOC109376208 n=1 Tax=Hipposideros armiger TaxID=186990 RepID=A0A8B7QHI2_HIPAR|nr:PREDICTED: uncharacterized protein LOC109376208 [Hipposideros armiger]